MKTFFKLLAGLSVAILLLGCGFLSLNPGAKNVTPSDNIITENREVSGFTGVDMSTIGTVTITQGEKEALVVRGSDNLVELVKTRVQGGVLVISMENVNIQSMKKENILTFEITVKNLDSLAVSGLGTVEMDELETKSLDLEMSGGGVTSIDKLSAEDVTANLSGLGNISLAGTASSLKADLSGAGELNAADLKVSTANVTISGVGTAIIWVMDELIGDISGAGSVRYYGDPKTNTQSSGVGSFEALGSK